MNVGCSLNIGIFMLQVRVRNIINAMLWQYDNEPWWKIPFPHVSTILGTHPGPYVNKAIHRPWYRGCAAFAWCGLNKAPATW